jgi:hypothetical protein
VVLFHWLEKLDFGLIESVPFSVCFYAGKEAKTKVSQVKPEDPSVVNCIAQSSELGDRNVLITRLFTAAIADSRFGALSSLRRHSHKDYTYVYSSTVGFIASEEREDDTEYLFVISGRRIKRRGKKVPNTLLTA